MLTFQQITEKAAAQGLDSIAITDHEVIDFAQLAKKHCRNQGLPLEVVVGAEITTARGHLVGLYLEKNIPSGKPLNWTIKEIHSQGGLVVAPHPFLRLTKSVGKKGLLEVISSHDPEVYFDGFEVFNGAAFDRWPQDNESALSFYTQFSNKLGSPIGGTDAHFRTIGRGLTGYTKPLREAIINKQTAVFYLNEKEQAAPADYLMNFYRGIILEPKRRIERFTQRELIGPLIPGE